MLLSNFNNGGAGIKFIDPTKLTPGVKKSPNVFILDETASSSIDFIDQGSPQGTIVIFDKSSNKWKIAGTVGVKADWDASSNTLPTIGVNEGDIYRIIKGGTINGISVENGDKIIAKIDNAGNNVNSGSFQDWTLVEFINPESTSIKRPNTESIEQALLKIVKFEYTMPSPSDDLNINHNKNSEISSVHFQQSGDDYWNQIDNWKIVDSNNINIKTFFPFQTGDKIRLTFNLNN